MTLTTLVVNIGITAAILTLLVEFVFKARKNWLVSYLQNFAGALFVFSGWVKAIDPLGTAYKMEQYFAEFETTFSETWMSFIAPLFPFLSSFSVGFSVFMIVFEIILGLMLLIGARPKLASWAFLLLVAFFTFLTGFTYLTGYVPQDVNFFEFGKWGPYVETNMKVTDCGCFGDFLKLKPRISFFKDLVLLVPAILFVWKWKDMHQLFTSRTRDISMAVATVGLVVYCMSNYVWDLPHKDFRPFNIGKDVAETKKIEEKAAEDVKVIAYNLTNKSTGEVKRLNYEAFLKEYKNYPKEEWEYEQIRSKPSMEPTKISDFHIEDVDGNDVTDEILEEPGYHFMVVCYKYYYDTQEITATKADTVFVADTIRTADTMYVEQKITEINKQTYTKEDYIFKPSYKAYFTEKVNPLVEAAEKAGHKVYGVVGGAGTEMIDDFRHDVQAAYPYYMADDILLKTIVRSNPGVVLWKNGSIVHKWHINKLPTFEEIQAKYIQ